MALNRDTSHKAYGAPRFRHAHVRIQSVSHTRFTNDSGALTETLGNQIDRLLNEEAENGRFPNKLSIEIDPPEEQDAHRIDD